MATCERCGVIEAVRGERYCVTCADYLDEFGGEDGVE